MKRIWKKIAFFAVANMLALTAAAHAEIQTVKFRIQVVACRADLYYALNESAAKQIARDAEFYLRRLDYSQPIDMSEWTLRTKCQFFQPTDYRAVLEKTSHDGVPAGKIAVCFQPLDFSVGKNASKERPCWWAVVNPTDIIVERVP